MKQSLESMTGFAETRTDILGTRLVCRVKSLNHRFLDVKLRLPRFNSGTLEMTIRKRISDRFKRGAIELAVALEAAKPQNAVSINSELARTYWTAACALAADLGESSSKLTLDGLLRLPGVASANASTGNDDLLSGAMSEADEKALVEGLIDPALNALSVSRLQEGEKLGIHLMQLTDAMAKHIEAIKKLEQPEKEAAKATMTARAQKALQELSLLGTVSDHARDEFTARLREEAVFWIERRDFEEERVRFETHLTSLRDILAQKAQSSGRRLEFTLQELGRETNTLGTKAQSPAIIAHTIELKTLLERFREQVANVS